MRVRAVVTLRFADAGTARAVAGSSPRGGDSLAPVGGIRGRAVHFQADGGSLTEVRDRVDAFLSSASSAERERKAPPRRRK